MYSRSRTPQSPKTIKGPGNFTNFLLLGFLAGLITANFVSAFDLPLVTTWTISGLLLSLVFSKLSYYLARKAQRQACDRAILTMERRMERLIPKRRMKAHGTHSHSPHAMEDCESNWMPVARRSRAKTNRRSSTFPG